MSWKLCGGIMAGFDNEVLYCSGERLEPSNAQSILLMQQAITDVARINHTGNPEGVISANPSSLSHDSSSGIVYVKKTGTGNIGWHPLDSGTITSVATANATPQFSLTGTVSTVDFNLNNLALGSSLPSLTTGVSNTGVGGNVLNAATSATNNAAFGTSSLQALTTGSINSMFGAASGASMTSGSNNNGFGCNTLLACTTGTNNCAMGFGSLGNSNSSNNCAIGHISSLNITSGNFNTSLGSMSLNFATSASNNTAIGYGSLVRALGSENTALGYNSGDAYNTTESSNILIKNPGVTGESNKIRIGINGSGLGQQNATFIAGIAGVTTSNSQMVTIDSTTGQLGSTSIPTGTVTSVSGTANRITSTVGATPVIDIATTYVGQNSITTLGTIATGTWQGSVVGLGFGGTNANLTASNGGIFYSTATAGAILSGTATAGQIIRSGANAPPSWSTATYPAIAGTNNTFLTSNGTNFINRGLSIVQQVFRVSGTYTPTTGMVYCTVEIVGGGGGSGGCAATAVATTASSGGGGGGEYASGVFSASTIGASQTVTIGAGGAAGTAGANNGGTGGTTSLGTLITAIGGSGSVGSAAAASTINSGGLGGTGGTGGTNRFPGGAGGFGFSSVPGGLILSGFGGSSPFAGSSLASTAAGVAGTGHGGGGGGCANNISMAARAGAAGSGGLVVINEFIIS
jgi:hypothetical protein